MSIWLGSEREVVARYGSEIESGWRDCGGKSVYGEVFLRWIQCPSGQYDMTIDQTAAVRFASGPSLGDR